MLIRSLLYYLLFSINLLTFSLVFLPLFILPQSIGLKVLKIWAITSQKILNILCKINYEVRGYDKIPQEKVLIASKHQSTWETINFLHITDIPPIMILKKELLLIPFFGLYALKFGNIAINRKIGVSSLKSMVKKARKSLTNGRHILIFPEGTRRAIDADPNYKRGILALYKNLGIPCVPVALNSGLSWPKNKIIKNPGKIIVEFLDPIPPGLNDKEFMETLSQKIENRSKELIDG
ncbi:MAG: lysophospholipid acyltransferase family protein [Hyphomicrobiales bacterium]|jgi:1-acyl-sn-glycerol-3-phosphate acyltransferase